MSYYDFDDLAEEESNIWEDFYDDEDRIDGFQDEWLDDPYDSPFPKPPRPAKAAADAAPSLTQMYFGGKAYESY
ncbi:hypothetical protein HXX76_012511 [Chlamydomonas incerta]|uniref:Uncharacterized protein n=1 Tax=Chlamydomonas incerta TaxID=51695 RepID=A0A835VW46_CHLIN|nr:hypothetical protein HXX76_012511 [Chlamydomonas incerta]|eukprot:KAG2427316.1 hypothetical protein HXX76_012511 [Chlamydomonas incerta]